jgi:hypothetical protein
MTRLPMNLPLDTMTQREVDNGEIASYQFLFEIDHKQHSLATGFYGPPIWFYLGGLTSGSAYCHFGVPQQVTKAGVVVYAAGEGRITCTTEDEAGAGIDTTGSYVNFDLGLDEASPGVSQGFSLANVETGATAAEQRVLTVASSADWSWQTCVVKVTVTANVVAYGISIIPIHESA